jgi:CO/xanthine dehydrogenase Mo-binding subunit
MAQTASRSTVLGGSAVFEGAAVLLDRIRAAAAVRLDCAPADIEITGSHAGAREAQAFHQVEIRDLRIVASH